MRLRVSVLFCVFGCAGLGFGLSAAAGQEKAPPGKAPYDRVCRVCHGDEGMGGAAPRLVPFSMEADELLIRVREGGGEMPPISENRVSDDDVKQIAAYLTAMSAAGAPASTGVPRGPSGR